MSTFKIGNTVTWRSQAQGTWKRKTGKVIEIVPAGANPHHKPRGSGDPRRAESYIVEVQVTPRSKPKLYWPACTALARTKK